MNMQISTTHTTCLDFDKNVVVADLWNEVDISDDFESEDTERVWISIGNYVSELEAL